jgi:hypothetical protein
MKIDKTIYKERKERKIGMTADRARPTLKPKLTKECNTQPIRKIKLIQQMNSFSVIFANIFLK